MAAQPAFVNLPDAVQWAIRQTFRHWAFQPPQNRARNQRQIVTGTGQWVAIPPANDVMAVGGEGAVHLWCLVDPATQTITDRIIVKQVMPGTQRFQMRRMWVNGIVGGQPIECFQANKVWAALPANDRQHVANNLGWGDVELNTWRYKLYLEYCEHGTLYNIISDQKLYPGRFKKFEKPLAEPFLWYLFESLAKVCVAMDQTPMIHGDLQTANVFFGAPNPTSFGMYPVPKVADFGSARTITPHVRLRLADLDEDPCCLEYAPPELSYDPNNPLVAWEVPGARVSETTNIWQVGYLMACAMRLKGLLPENDWRQPLRPYTLPVDQQLHHNAANTGIGRNQLPYSKIDYHGLKKYSPRLVRLVMRCMRHDPRYRPRASNLLAQIRQQADFKGTDIVLPHSAPISAALRQYNIRLKRGRYDRWQLGRAGP